MSTLLAEVTTIMALYLSVCLSRPVQLEASVLTDAAQQTQISIRLKNMYSSRVFLLLLHVKMTTFKMVYKDKSMQKIILSMCP